MRKGDPDMLTYLNTVLEFHRGSGWLAERVRYWIEKTTQIRPKHAPRPFPNVSTWPTGHQPSLAPPAGPALLDCRPTPAPPCTALAVPMQTPGNLFVVAAPSGTGKSSLVKALLELDSHLAVSVSHTTRAPRGQEQDGREYHFIDEPRFRAMVERGEFFEWAQVHGNLYGTSRVAIEDRLQAGQDIVLEIDWQGALQIKKLFPDAVLIFILPPNWQELLQRLERRGEDGPQVIEQRMANARIEVAQARHFDFVIINALFEMALFDLKTIVHSQRLKYAAQARHRPQVFAALDLN
jgi:guanylate kinase